MGQRKTAHLPCTAGGLWRDPELRETGEEADRRKVRADGSLECCGLGSDGTVATMRLKMKSSLIHIAQFHVLHK